MPIPALDNPLIAELAELLREFMRDHPELNRLTAGYDHSPRHMRWAVIDTISDWQSTPPFIGQNLQMIIDRNWLHPFIRGCAIECLESVGILHLRNHLSYSDGGVNVQIENPQLIRSWVDMFRQSYEHKKQRALIAANIEGALSTHMGGVHSEYVFVNAFYGSL